MKSIKPLLFLVLISLVSCQDDDDYESPGMRMQKGIQQTLATSFRSFTVSGQTSPSHIYTGERKITFEVANNVDLKSLIPVFTTGSTCTVTINGAEQVSGVSVVDFTSTVSYRNKLSNGFYMDWKVTAFKLP